MKFIQKDINKRLLAFIMILMVLLTSLTIYYTMTFTELSNKYNKNQKLFGELTANAVADNAGINSVQKYKENLEKRYDDLSTVNSNLKAEIVDLKSQINFLKSQAEYVKAKEVGPTEQFRLFQAKNDEINKLREKLRDACSEFEAHNIMSKECNGIS